MSCLDNMALPCTPPPYHTRISNNWWEISWITQPTSSRGCRIGLSISRNSHTNPPLTFNALHSSSIWSRLPDRRHPISISCKIYTSASSSFNVSIMALDSIVECKAWWAMRAMPWGSNIHGRHYHSCVQHSTAQSWAPIQNGRRYSCCWWNHLFGSQTLITRREQP